MNLRSSIMPNEWAEYCWNTWDKKEEDS